MKNTEKHNEPDLRINGISDSDLKRNPFKAPEGYFENLTPRVMESVRASEEKTIAPTINWWRVLLPGLGFASMVLAVWFFDGFTESDDSNFEQVVASMTLEELDEFAEFETDELLAYGLIDSEELEVESNFTEDELIDYLIDEEIELNSIYEEIDI
ncbi:MAG: hypothetical protein ACPGU4_06190 [Flavobacteriales bacterium]